VVSVITCTEHSRYRSRTQPVGLLQRCFCWSSSWRRSTSAVHS